MTVDESQMSTASASSGTPKTKAAIVNSPDPRSPRPSQNQFAQPEAVPPSPKPIHSFEALSDVNSFEAFAQSNSAKADELMGKLVEVTGMTDRVTLYRAFDQSRKSDPNHEFNVTHAIEWILSLSECSSVVPSNSDQQQRNRRKTPVQSQFVSPANANSSPTSAANSTAAASVAAAVNNHGFAPIQPPNSPATVMSGAGGEVVKSNSSKPLVDLTDSSNDSVNKNMDADLEKAIQLSLQEVKRTEGSNFGVTQEEQDVSRALEASLMENQFGSKGSRGMIDYVDPLNPHDRERHGMWPVGLKNVGQTCWFSAVIQSLFYLPAFRSLVLNFPPPQNREFEKLQDFGNDRRKKIVEFMLELRKLFALMVGTQRKYVDPSRAVDILRGSIGTLNKDKDVLNIETNNQQDVSEFTHIVLEWVEEAFKGDALQPKCEADMVMQMDADCEKENNEEKDVPDKEDTENNPMSRLFYGKVLTEGRILGETFVREEAFGQWPLQVNNFTNIHESLENSLAHESLDAPVTACSSSTDLQSKSGQERWFLRLPPVLFLELSRFQYNMERKTAEKIHNRLDFPHRIFMDRYIADNKVVTRQKREEVRALKEKRAMLKARLDKFTHYGTMETTDPAVALPQILQRTLDFARSKPSAATPALANLAVSNLMQVDSPCGSPKMTPASSFTNLASAVSSVNNGGGNGANSYSLNDCDEAMDVEMAPAEGSGCDSTNTLAEACSVSKNDKDLSDPHPRLVTDKELQVLQDCLSRWKLEVEQDMSSLVSAIQEIDGQIENMYVDESLQKHEYQLHAVMVHEGSIDSGHYWAYVLDHRRKVWLKFNDNTVNEASWEELAKESMGGHSNTSAYSLVYIDTSKSELLMDAVWAGSIGETKEDKMDQGELEALALTLPFDLAQYVSDDNSQFQDEITQWDKEQQALKQQELMAASQKQQDMEQSTTAADGNDVQVVEEKLTYVNNHAKLSMDLTMKVFNAVEKMIKEKGIQTTVLTALEKIIQHYCNSHKERNVTVINLDNGASGPPKAEVLPRQDYRLESFVYYLLKNDETNNMPLVELAVLEQFSFPGLENNTQTMSAFRAAADSFLTQRRSKNPHEAEALRQWHQAYHFFRRSVHCFVSALEAQMESNFVEALDLYTEAYNFTVKADNVPVSGNSRSLKENLIVRYLCKVLPEVNRMLVSQLKRAENLNEIVGNVQTLIVPVLLILQTRADQQQRNNQLGYGGIDAQTLEEVRGDWCALLGDPDPNNAEASAIVTEIIPIVLLDSTASAGSIVQTSKNRDTVQQSAELNLFQKYIDIVGHHLRSSATSRPQTNPSNFNSQSSTNSPAAAARASTPQQIHQLEP